MSNLLLDVDFGHIDAEADPNLISYFLETNSYSRIFKGEKTYVVGRKGTGKSAIYITIENLKHHSLSISGLSFDDYPWRLHNKVKDESKSADFAFVNTWKYIILLELAKLLLREYKETDPKIQEIATYLRTVYGSLNPSFKEFIVNKFKKFQSIDLPEFGPHGAKCGSLKFEDTKAPEEKLMASINIINSNLQEKIFGLLSTEKVYFIMFDKLDDGWDNTDDSKSSLIGLLRACRDLNLDSKKSKKLLRCLPFLRSDIYDCLQYNDKNKCFPDIEFLRWDEQSLASIINKRIANSLKTTEKAAWETIFDKKPMAKGTSSFNYILKRTLLRPRDLIQFCYSCKEVALSKRHSLITGDDIYEAENSYSEFVYREFIDEAHKQYPFIEQLFEALRGLKYERFTFQNFDREFNSIASLKKIDGITSASALKILFDFSIIGIDRIGGKGGGSYFEFKYTDPLIQPEFTRSMIIHPSLKKHLKLIEMRKKKC